MEATEILKSALVQLQNMTPKEVQERSKLKDIKVEKEPGNSDFTIDLQGIMPEAIKVGSKYRFVCQIIDEVVTITELPVKNNGGFLEYGARNKEGIYRICFNDELFELETSDSTC